jgi:hypothetical protein
MSLQDRIILFALGVLIWIVGSIYFAYRGPQILETTQLRYWASFFLSPILSAILAIVVLKLLRIPPPDWASAALLLAIPGMVGEAIALSHLSTFMPKIQESSGGRYGAFLFATYALVLGIAECIALKATP